MIGGAILLFLLLISTTRVLRLLLPIVLLLAWAPVARAWSWPVQGPVVQPFAYDESHPYASGQHRGIDIGADDAGQVVVAPAAGTISFAGTVPTSGLAVTIETQDGYSVTLTHLGSSSVSNGATVAEGDTIGTVGPSGTPEVDGPYVHLGIRLTADQNGYVDPLGLLPAVTTETPPTEDDSTGTQPSASGGSAATPPATEPAAPAAVSTQPASTPAASTPAATTRSSTVQPKHVRSSSQRGRASGQTTRPRVERPRSSQRPGLTASSPITSSTPRQAVKPKQPLSEPRTSAHRPVVEAAAPRVPGEPAIVDVGQELRPSVPVAQPQQPQPQPQGQTPDVLSLFCNSAAALVALAAALAAARRRRLEVRTSPVADVQVLHLPGPAADWRRRDAA
ncbi:MAG TPA: peptidoglycan DD-metalloendopeptidase family protein [Gaiellaceae bacterium]|nr:peptidoglycan DD-metalloendopeptidase family protein [Gaiellaceae bacterium]